MVYRLFSFLLIALVVTSVLSGAIAADTSLGSGYSMENDTSHEISETTRNPESAPETAEPLPSSNLSKRIDELLAEGKPVFLFFYSDWCDFCQEQKPIIDELETGYNGSIAFIRVTADENPYAFVEFEVYGFPTMFLIVAEDEDGYVYQLFDGFTDKSVLEESFEYVLEYGTVPERLSGSFSSSDLTESGISLTSSQTGDEAGAEHHSCSFWTCYSDCVIQEQSPITYGWAYQQMLDYAQDCAGVTAAKDIANAYKYSKLAKCSSKCGEIEESADAKAILDCTRCSLSGAVGQIPVAGCVVGLWDTLGDLLEPHANCISECAGHPSTWSQNWGHPCRDYISPEKWKCLGEDKAVYKCKDCEYQLDELDACPLGKECAMTKSGPVCKDPCKDIDCDDGDPCTLNWCTDGECWWDYWDNPLIPGCDKPDESFDVSSLSPGSVTTAIGSTRSGTIYEPPEIAVLSSGFNPYFIKLLTQINESGEFINVSLQGVEEYSVLVIPSGGLYGLDRVPTFTSRLEQYVRNGGTLIVFTQQHGYEFAALPGNVSGYGWLEDQSCQYNSVGIATYHPIFARQTSEVLSVNVDGFFTAWPTNSSVLLMRTKNSMPAMLLYEYGRGRVLATTLYSDMAWGLHQQTATEKTLIKDMLTWATSSNEIQTYAPGTVNVSVNITNLIYGPLDYPVPEFGAGDTVNLSVNVTNRGNVTGDTVSFALFDPLFNLTWVNVSCIVASNESTFVDLYYRPPASAKSGIWSIIYLVCAGKDPIAAGWGGEFAYDYNITNLSRFEAFVTVRDPDDTVVKEEQNISLSIRPGETGQLNVTNLTIPLTTLGLWSIEYSVLPVENDLLDPQNVLISDVAHFAVSNYAENPDGFAYQGKNITFSVNSDRERYVYGTNATFTITMWNHGETAKEVTCWWNFPHNYRATDYDPVYGCRGTMPGHRSGLYNTVTVPAHGVRGILPSRYRCILNLIDCGLNFTMAMRPRMSILAEHHADFMWLSPELISASTRTSTTMRKARLFR